MDLQQLKKRLIEEKGRLEEQLKTIATPSKERPGDWEPILTDLNIQRSTPEEMADKFEETENAVAAESALEKRLQDINAALQNMEDGSYGTCTVCHEPIPGGRLEADPSAATCTKHAGR